MPSHNDHHLLQIVTLFEKRGIVKISQIFNINKNTKCKNIKIQVQKHNKLIRSGITRKSLSFKMLPHWWVLTVGRSSENKWKIEIEIVKILPKLGMAAKCKINMNILKWDELGLVWLVPSYAKWVTGWRGWRRWHELHDEFQEIHWVAWVGWITLS